MRRVPLRTKIVFAMGSAAEMIALTSVGGFALFYYNQVLGMSATMAGLAMSISLIFDGLADPIIGSLSDRTRHKLGRRHPYPYLAPVPIAISLIGVFNPPAGMPHLWLFFWFTAFVLSLRVFMAMYHTPHLAMVAEMSADYTERSRILSWNTLFSFAGRSGTTFVALSLFFHKTEEYPRGLLNPEAYAPFAFTGAGLCVALLMASAWFTRDQIPYMRHVPDHIKPFSFVEFFKDVGAAVSNRNYFFLLIGLFFISLTTGLTVSLALYINTYLWQLPSEQIRWLEIGTLAGFVLGFFITAKFHDRFGKRAALIVCSSVSAASYSVPIVLWLTGLMPVENNPYLMPILIACAALTALTGCGMTISGMSAMADIADENELRIGRRQEGILYSTRTLFAKLDIAIGQFVAGVALDIVHFPRKAAPGAVELDTLVQLAWIYGPIAAIPGIISAVFYAQYRISKTVFAETRHALEERRRAAAAAAETKAPAAP